MRIAVVAETAPGERRVAAVPETVRRLTEAGWDVAVERGAGLAAFVTDDAYIQAGAEVVGDLASLVRRADVLLSVQPVPLSVLAAVEEGTAVVSMLTPSTYPDHVRLCRARRLTAFALELVPRISRAQSVDVLSSQALVAGYRAALIAAERLPGVFPMATTAAGTVPAAEVLVLGTGVAGLSAIATARRLGALTSASDVRPSSAEEVRSLGATFLPLGRAPQEGAGGYARTQSEDFLASQRALLTEHIGAFDAVITTAAVPGRRAPLLVTTAMVEQMRPGSIVVDLAAETGGNCELTRPGEQVEHRGVVVTGPLDVPSQLPRAASELFSRNVAELLLLMTENGEFVPDRTDEVLAGCCLTRDGEVVHPAAREALGEAGPARRPTVEPVAPPVDAAAAESREVRRGSMDDVARLLAHSRTVVIVPGYGLAVAQAQHAVRVLGELLRSRGAEVSYAVHPVAGRLPGHLNVLLDEAGVPHENIVEVEQANAEFDRTDVVLVVGANDVVNPAARSDGSAISGMPILDVGAARHVVFLQRDLRPGFAGVDNPLFSAEGTTLLFGDAKETLIGLIAALAHPGSG